MSVLLGLAIGWALALGSFGVVYVVIRRIKAPLSEPGAAPSLSGIVRRRVEKRRPKANDDRKAYEAEMREARRD